MSAQSFSIPFSAHPLLDFIPCLAEIRAVVFSFKPFKAPGSDGMHPFMYQKF